jgi:hypothetical protein
VAHRDGVPGARHAHGGAAAGGDSRGSASLPVRI